MVNEQSILERDLLNCLNDFTQYSRRNTDNNCAVSIANCCMHLSNSVTELAAFLSNNPSSVLINEYIRSTLSVALSQAIDGFTADTAAISSPKRGVGFNQSQAYRWRAYLLLIDTILSSGLLAEFTFRDQQVTEIHNAAVLLNGNFYSMLQDVNVCNALVSLFKKFQCVSNFLVQVYQQRIAYQIAYANALAQQGYVPYQPGNGYPNQVPASQHPEAPPCYQPQQATVLLEGVNPQAAQPAAETIATVGSFSRSPVHCPRPPLQSLDPNHVPSSKSQRVITEAKAEEELDEVAKIMFNSLDL